MNTEDRLRRASREIEQATASLTPPPIKDVRRSARMRGLGVALASAAGVVILVGGALLLVSGSGPSTIDPAAPGETTSTTEATQADVVVLLPEESLVIAQAAAMPEIVVESTKEAALVPTDRTLIKEDLSFLREARYHGPFDDEVEIVAIGQMADSQNPPRAYAIRGRFAGDGPDELAGRQGECIVAIAPTEGWTTSCGIGPRGGVALTMQLADGTVLVAGRAPEDTALVEFEWDATSVWQITRDEYFLAPAGSSIDGQVSYVYYDISGKQIDSGSLLQTCSGSDLIVPETFDGVPENVLAKVLGILDAAQACDYGRLEAIAGDAFTASFGGGDPSDLWTMEEEQGYKPMYWLISILSLPHGVIETENGNLYVWPSAYAHQGSWETTPEADVEALRSLYSESDLQDFADFGGYFGYRIGIWENGDWSFFVAGD